MCQFIETICYKNGQFHNLDLHQERFDLTRKHFFGAAPELQLESFLKIPDTLIEKNVKCRVLYDKEILNIEYNNYTIKNIGSLQLVFNDSIDYAFKFAEIITVKCNNQIGFSITKAAEHESGSFMAFPGTHRLRLDPAYLISPPTMVKIAFPCISQP